jgi:signal transduction histidine kinase
VQLTVTPIRNNKGVITGYLFVAVDVSNVKEVKGKLRSLLEITLQQNKRLTNFAHIVSHNLRSHSANIEMLIDLLLQDHPQLLSDQSAIYLQKASQNLKETIVHLNEVVAINAEENKSLVPVQLRAAIEQNLQSLIQEIQESKIKVINQVPADIEVHALPAYVESITLNLLTNAIKYRNRQVDSFVKFEAKVREGFVIFTVEDNGLGIDLSMHGGKIFKMYKTFHGNKDSRGIGLFITKNQIEAMGGSINVVSEVKVGTTFTVKLRHEEH